MKLFSIKAFRIVSLTSFALILALGFACKKDDPKPEPNPSNNGGGGNGSPIASADLNFVDLGKAFDFKCYDKNDGVDHITIKNDTLHMIFGNNQTSEGDTVVLQVMIAGVTDINVGDTYSVNGGYSEAIAFSVYANNAPELGYTASNVGSPYSNSGELKITSKDGNHVKGTIYFTGYTFPNPMNPSPQKEVVVSNGKIDCDFVLN